MRVLCERNGYDCREVIDLPMNVLTGIKTSTPDRIIIVDGCPTGPEPTDVLVSTEPGYTIYRERRGDDR